MPAPAASYRVVIVTSDRKSDADLLESSIYANALLSGGRRANLEITRDPSVLEAKPRTGDPTTLAVFLTGTRASASDKWINDAANACLKNFIPALPVHDPKRAYELQMPQVLHPINGSKWIPSENPDETAAKVLKLLGLAEDDQRIFISYRQLDAAHIVEQLRHAFLDERWDVFLDRFSIPPGVNFQERLDKELADKAFVLLVESPEVSTSKWVEHEVAFALIRKLGLLALTLPTVKSEELHPAIQETLRLRLTASDFCLQGPQPRLAADALKRVVEEIDRRHSEAFTLRRESAMLEASEEMRRHGYDVSAIDQWGLLGTKEGQREVALVTARAPEARDLRLIHALRMKHRKAGTPTRGWVVHPTEDIDSERSSLLEWLTTHRQISSTPVMLLGQRMRA